MSAPTPTGWADKRLMKAYDLLDEVQMETPFDHPAHALLRRAGGLIEDADMEIEGEVE